MATMIVNHKVADFNTWKSVFDSLYTTRKNYGCTGEKIYRGSNDPNELVIFTQWGNPDEAKQYGSSQELKDAFKNGGVTVDAKIYFVD